MSTFKLAWRNLGRNRRRTLIAGAALVVGVALSVAGYGLMDGMNAELLRALTKNELGDVQVHNPAYPESHALKDLVRNPQEIEQEAMGIKGVVALTPRVYAFALVSAHGKSLGAQLVGVAPATERKVTTLQQQAIAGHYLDDDPTPWPRGRKLSGKERALDAALTAAAEAEALAEIEGFGAESEGEQAPAASLSAKDLKRETRALSVVLSPPPERAPQVYVGAIIAEILGVGIGDQIHATGQALDGVNEEVFFEVVGIFQTGTAMIDRSRIYMHIVDLQRFIHVYDGVHELSLVATSPAIAGTIADSLQALVGDKLLVRPWWKIRPDVRKMIDLSDLMMGIMIAIIFFVAALGVVNTMLMAVYERTRELGMLKAIGMSGARIMGLIITETLLMVLIFSLIGTAGGLALDVYMLERGVDLSGVTEGFSVGGVGIRPVFHGVVTTQGLVLPSLILSGICLLASLYPAARAARLRPAVGMRET
jgi:ABC-type lipoprotein release transport system permease subunit